MPPAQPGALLDDWITRAGHAGFYRQAAHITDPHIAIGPRPAGRPGKGSRLGPRRPRPQPGHRRARHTRRQPRPARARRPRLRPGSRSRPARHGRPIDEHRNAPPSSRGRPSSTRPPAATRTPPSPAPPPPGKPGSPTSSSPATRPAPGGNATTNPSGWPPAPPARNSTAAASSPPPNPASPTPKPPTSGSRTPPSRPSPGRASRAASSAWWQQYTAQADKTEAAIAAERQAAAETGQPWPPQPHFGPAPEPAAKPRTTLQWQPEAGPDTAHVDPAWWAQIKAEQTARVQIAKAARRETAARAIPVTDAEIALYGTRHHEPETRAAEPEPLLAAPTEHDDPGAHETSSQYYARMQSYARWQPETHPEATAGPATAPEAHHAEPDLEP